MASGVKGSGPNMVVCTALTDCPDRHSGTYDQNEFFPDSVIDLTSSDWPISTTFLVISISGKTSEQTRIEIDGGIHYVLSTCHVVRFGYTNLMQPLVRSPLPNEVPSLTLTKKILNMYTNLSSTYLRLYCLCHNWI